MALFPSSISTPAMGSDNHQEKSTSSLPTPALSTYPRAQVTGLRASTANANLRVRPKSGSGVLVRSPININSTRKPLSRREECYSAVLPALLIFAVWCFGCYIYLWVTLYQSFADDIGGTGDHTNNIIFANKRNDILAVKLEQFLTGNTDEVDAIENDTPINNNGTVNGIGDLETIVHFSKIDATLLEQIADASVAKQIQSALLSQTGYPNLILGAYLEPPLPIHKANGTAIQRLKLRTNTPDDLTHISYPYKHPQANNAIDNKYREQIMPGACSQQGAQWILPTSHPKTLDKYFEGNVFKKHNNFDKRWQLANGTSGSDTGGYCPVDADPYLPWIHDIFPTNDGRHVEFIISNKRRCNTDPNVFQPDLKNLEPQAALMQPIPVKRLQEGDYEGKLRDALGKLWSPPELHTNSTYSPPRYILGTSLDDADEDGTYTRFICRFHTVIIDKGEGATNNEAARLKNVMLGETLSAYTYNPEHANYRKRGSKPILTSAEQGKDEQVWNSVYSVRCPVPHFKDGEIIASDALARLVASGKSVNEGIPSLYLDLIPIRTPVRTTREGFGLPGVTSPESSLFDPKLAWGDSHVVPRVEASGRWSNIPICRSPKVDENAKVNLAPVTAKAPTKLKDVTATASSAVTQTNKTHFLVACVWASQSFSTRGQTYDTDTSTSDRLREFLTYHTQIAGFDHVYVYDNSDTSSSNGTLKDVTDLFPSKHVTRIPWPHRLCNNNRPAHSNPGFRSSQYAAENSCRARYGSDTTWLAALDADEYLIPTGKQWKSIRHWLEHVTSTEDSTKILSFYQTRALPNIDSMVPYDGSSMPSCKVEKNEDIEGVLKSMCAMKDQQKTYMETYNCEPTTHPKPQQWAWRAKKQIYRPDFVLNHFVHYSVVTKRILDSPLETSPRFVERSPYERRVNELTEGFLLHTKTTGPDQTSKWHEKCLHKQLTKADTKKNSNCKVGIPSSVILGDPGSASVTGGLSNNFESTCYQHSRVMNEWVPKLDYALKALNNKR